MTIIPDQREQARKTLLQEIRHLQVAFDARKERMVVAAQETGRTSLVNTVTGIETALNAAYKKVERS